MTDTLEPCPVCSAESCKIDAYEDKGEWCTVCRYCGLRGPYRGSEHAAILDWNRIALTLRDHARISASVRAAEETKKVVEAARAIARTHIRTFGSVWVNTDKTHGSDLQEIQCDCNLCSALKLTDTDEKA